MFVGVGGACLVANLIKSILGRARPKLFDSGGPLDFNLVAFTPDYASFPSGHATSIFALTTVIGILWARVLLYAGAAWIALTRPLIGAHYFTDAVAGAILCVLRAPGAGSGGPRPSGRNRGVSERGFSANGDRSSQGSAKD